MEIVSVKIQGNGYLINGSTAIPKGYSGWMKEELDIWLSTNTPEPEFTQVDIINNAREHFVALTTNLIQAKVDEYNKANGTDFASIHSAANYRFNTQYTHQPFCERVWNWNVAIWEAVKAWQGTLTTIPTDAQWKAVVDGVVY